MLQKSKQAVGTVVGIEEGRGRARPYIPLAA